MSTLLVILISFMWVFSMIWVYTLNKENKRLREKYRLCCAERTELADTANALRERILEQKIVVDAVNGLERDLAAIGRHLDPKSFSAKNSIVLTMSEFADYERRILQDADAITSKFLTGKQYGTAFTNLANYICALGFEWERSRKRVDELQSDLETSKNLVNCYLLSRNQARDDIQAMKMILVAGGTVGNQEQLDALCKCQGLPAPEDIRAAQTFEDFYKLAQDRGLVASKELSTTATPPSGQLNPPKPRSTRGRK